MTEQEGNRKCAREGCENPVHGARKYCSARCSNIAIYEYLEKYNKRTRPHKERKGKNLITHSGIEVSDNWFGEFMMHGDIEPNKAPRQKKSKKEFRNDVNNYPCTGEEMDADIADDYCTE
jgi:endogenous inhibitor of DNA gyrase (YacG/DUF329 family)